MPDDSKSVLSAGATTWSRMPRGKGRLALRHSVGAAVSMGDRTRSTIRAVLADCSAATAIEYALVALFISIVIVAGCLTIGSIVSGWFNDMAAGL
ncbi:MAG TPA: Flp family type IVb pilin [Stellaceae bacterium]|nr:Flp family type IVb pilin [Stellaceae bacterium]